MPVFAAADAGVVAALSASPSPSADGARRRFRLRGRRRDLRRGRRAAPRWRPAPRRPAPRALADGSCSRPFAAAPTAAPKPRNATSSSAQTCAGGSTRAHARARPAGPLVLRAHLAELAFHLRQLRVELLQLAARAQQHVVAEVVADRHLVGEPAEIPVQFGDASGQLLAAALELGSRAHLAGFDDVRQVLRLLLVAAAAALRVQVLQRSTAAPVCSAPSRRRERAWLCSGFAAEPDPFCLALVGGFRGCRRRRGGRAAARRAGPGADGDHLRRRRRRRSRPARAPDQHPDTHREQQHADARDQRQHVAALPGRG